MIALSKRVVLMGMLSAALAAPLHAQDAGGGALKELPRRVETPASRPQSAVSPSGAGTDAPANGQGSATSSSGQVVTKYDSMVYRKDGVIEFKGNVVIQRGEQELRADYVIYNRETEEADAYGNVVVKRGAEIWRGDRLHYNFKLGTGDSDSMSYNASPFSLRASKIERIAGNKFRASSSRITTCEHGFDSPHFLIRSREIVLDPGESIAGRNTTFFFGSVPFFYLPYWYRDLDESTGWRFRPGYSSEWGAFLLSSYRYPLSAELKGETHLDYRSERGIGLGQDFGWGSDSSQGSIELYYVDDDRPLDEDDDPDKDIDSSRYRCKVKNTSSYTGRNTLYLQGEYVSDIDMREDFFESEYKDSVQPDNYIVFQHRGDSYVGSVLGQMRLNDFYQGVNRIPEISLDVLRQPLADTLLYYESQTDFSNLERVYAEPDSNLDYSCLRIDTAHLVNYPGKYFGFLTVIPRTGARATYYSATAESTTTETTSIVSVTNSVTGEVTSSVQTNSVTSLSDGPGALRTRFEIGCETSFKAYRTWGGAAAPRRHVVEPYANYTLVPEPNVMPDELYQFDSVDKLRDMNQVQLGVRNKYQKKVDGKPYDVIDVNLYTFLLFDPDEGQDSLQNFYFDGRLRPGMASLVKFDGYYDTTASELARFNTRLEYKLAQLWELGAEYHYVVDESSLIAADVTFMPERPWTWNVFCRYEGEESRMEEVGGYIQRNLDCLSIRTRMSVLPGYERSDGSTVDDEFRVMLEFWLRAFPEMQISGHGGG